MQVGDASVDPNMDPTELISSTGAALQCVFIASAYRLSALGFLASSELAAEAVSLGEENFWGNYGLWDQRLALDWVHENVGKWFGGNTREKLTLAGRSAGAYSVHAQVCHEFFMRKDEQKEDAPMFNRLIMYGTVERALRAEVKSRGGDGVRDVISHRVPHKLFSASSRKSKS